MVVAPMSCSRSSDRARRSDSRSISYDPAAPSVALAYTTARSVRSSGITAVFLSKVPPLKHISTVQIPWTGAEAYAKNLRLQMGRCPVRSVFWPASQLLRKKQHLFGSVILALAEISQTPRLLLTRELRQVLEPRCLPSVACCHGVRAV